MYRLIPSRAARWRLALFFVIAIPFLLWRLA